MGNGVICDPVRDVYGGEFVFLGKEADMLYQQGDVLIEGIVDIPKEAKRLMETCIVLAEGEATGHAHVITDKLAKAFCVGDALFLELSKDTEVKHEEHGTVTLSPGKYKVGIVREYDHFAEEAHRVQD